MEKPQEHSVEECIRTLKITFTEAEQRLALVYNDMLYMRIAQSQNSGLLCELCKQLETIYEFNKTISPGTIPHYKLERVVAIIIDTYNKALQIEDIDAQVACSSLYSKCCSFRIDPIGLRELTSSNLTMQIHFEIKEEV